MSIVILRVLVWRLKGMMRTVMRATFWSSLTGCPELMLIVELSRQTQLRYDAEFKSEINAKQDDFAE